MVSRYISKGCGKACQVCRRPYLVVNCYTYTDHSHDHYCIALSGLCRLVFYHCTPLNPFRLGSPVPERGVI